MNNTSGTVIHFVIGRPKAESKNGIVKVVYQLINNRNKHNFNIQCWSLSKSKFIEDNKEHTQIFNRSINRFILDKKIYQELKKINHRQTLFHFHGCFTPEYNVLARLLRKRNIPYVVSTHGILSPLSLKKNFIIKSIYKLLLDKFFLNNARAIFSLGPNETSDIKDYLGHENKIYEIPNGITQSTLFADETFQVNDSRKLTAIFIGRLDMYQKGIDIILNTFQQPGVRESNIELHIYGTDHKNSRSKIAQFIRHHNMADIVKLQGPVFGENKRIVLTSADFFIQPSRAEGMPIAVLEALSSGLICLVTKESNLERTFIDHACGVIVERNPLAISKELIALSRDRSKIRQIRRNAKLVADTIYSWPKILDQYINAYGMEISQQ